ncbi:putative rlpA-like protein, double-psi beta-barrel [Helianthus anomalus]
MSLLTRACILIAMVASLTSVAHAVAGRATFYTPPYTPNPALYNNGATCGRRYHVTCTGRTNDGILQPCTGRSVDVTVVDLCPTCATRQIDLSREAFAVIANPDAGLINVEYTR